MHPRLRVLTSPPREDQESLVHAARPILQAAPPRRRTLPAFASLLLTPLAVLALALGMTTSPVTSARTLRAAGPPSVRLVLTETTPSPRALPVPGLQADIQRLRGAGHREGTSTLDPRLVTVRTSTLPLPSEAIDPDSLSTSPRAEPVFLALNPALPLQAGGNGLSAGTGREAYRGRGSRDSAVAAPDLRVVPIHQVPLFHQLRPGERPDLVQPTRVRILIGADGVPTQAQVLSGPAYLHDQAREAALGWRFEPLEPHGLKAPLTLTLTFHPVLQARR